MASTLVRISRKGSGKAASEALSAMSPPSGREMVSEVVPLDPSISWIADGACLARQDVDWFATDEAAIEIAKGVCLECRVQTACLVHAVTHNEFGVWGATTESERTALRQPYQSGRARRALSLLALGARAMGESDTPDGLGRQSGADLTDLPSGPRNGVGRGYPSWPLRGDGPPEAC